MPTPFMHLHAAHRFLLDETVPSAIRAELAHPNRLGAFLLGNVAPDARVSGGMARGNTHFFEYTPPKIDPRAKIALFDKHPELKMAQGEQRAFIAGYLAHLAMDIIWAENLLFPYFYAKEWSSIGKRFIMLHVLLCHLDELDFQQWDSGFGAALIQAHPTEWLPFLPDADLVTWRDIIARQICPTCQSETLAILGSRVTVGEGGLHEILESPEKMESELWVNVPREAVTAVGAAMYHAMIADIVEYLEG